MHLNETVTPSGGLAARLPMGLLGEERLARMAAKGERRAFEAIFERYHQELYRYCRAIVGEPQDAHDALQSTMAIAMRSLPQEEHRVALRAWLYRVAHNESISILRRRHSPVDVDSLPEPSGPGADICAEDRERVSRLVSDLQELPERHRGALVMRELSGLGYAEIGKAIDCSDAAARQVVYEARESLRELEIGREMECESARRMLSERDGRLLRGRRLRAHLSACTACSDYQAAIGQRRSDLGALAPALAPTAAASMLAAVLGGVGNGGSAGAAGAIAGTAGGGAAALGGSAALKAASILSVVVLGAGTAGVAGVVHFPSIGGGHNSAATASAESGSAHAAGVVAARIAHSHGVSSTSRGAGAASHGQARSSHHASSANARHRGALADRGNSRSDRGESPPGATSSSSSQSQAGSHGNGYAYGQSASPGGGPRPDTPAATQSQRPASAGSDAPAAPSSEAQYGQDQAAAAQSKPHAKPDSDPADG